MTTKFIETKTGIMSLIWTHDPALARIYFDDFLTEYEQTGRSGTYKRRGYACKDLAIIRIHGYSKGDINWIKVPTTEATDKMREYLTHIFYDSPIYASISIEGGDGYELVEFYEDIYDSSREALIRAIEKSDIPSDIKARALALVPVKQEYAAYD